MARLVPIVLTIAGSDSSGGAGIQADLKTFSALGVYGASVITALTAQNTRGVQAIHAVPADFIAAQIDAVRTDLDIAVIKTGMTGTAEAIHAIADGIRLSGETPVIVDPVMAAESGDRLIDDGAVEALRAKLFPLAGLITPNLDEAARLLGEPTATSEDGMRTQARKLHETGAQAVLVKGGHATGAEAVDILYDGQNFRRFAAKRIATDNAHGTGCTLSSAVAAYMALGCPLIEAVERAKEYLTLALAHADELDIGAGGGPVHHFHALWAADGDKGSGD